MKKPIALLVLLALVATLLPIGTDAADNKTQIVQVLSITEGTAEENVYPIYHLKEAQLKEYWEADEFFKEEDVVLVLEHMTMIRQRTISNNGDPVECSFRAWGTGNKFIIAFFRPADETEWSVEAFAQGEYLDVTFPGDGEYALAWAW